MRGIPSTIISIIVAWVSMCVVPIFYICIILYARTTVTVLFETRNLIDEVIDTGTLTEDTLDDYYLSLASTTSYYDVTITHKVSVVNPDPTNPGEIYTTYVVVDDIYNYNRGDRIVVKVEPVGQNLYQVLVRTFLSIMVEDEGFTLAGRVR